jgi:hypothetical protein
LGNTPYTSNISKRLTTTVLDNGTSERTGQLLAARFERPERNIPARFPEDILTVTRTAPQLIFPGRVFTVHNPNPTFATGG